MLAIGAPRGRSWGVGHVRLDTWSAAHVLILAQKLTFSPAPLALETVAGPLLRPRAGVPALQVGLADLRTRLQLQQAKTPRCSTLRTCPSAPVSLPPLPPHSSICLHATRRCEFRLLEGKLESRPTVTRLSLGCLILVRSLI